MRSALTVAAAPRSRPLVRKRLDKHPRRSSGFTLIELVSCIVIIGILAAVAVPSLFNNQAFTSRGYADELASSLRYAQRIAIASGCPVQVDIDGAGYRGWQRANFISYNNCTGAWSTPVMRADGTSLAGVTPGGVNVNPDTSVEFRPSGAIAGGSVAITVDAFTVDIDFATGRVSRQ